MSTPTPTGRTMLLGSAARPARRITIETPEGPVEVELRQPSLAKKGKIAEAAGGEDSPDLELFVAHALLSCAYVPGSLNRFFKAEDLDALLAAGPELDELQRAAIELMGGSEGLGNESAESPSSAQS